MDKSQIRLKCIKETRKKIRESVSDDQLLIQAVNSIEELGKVANMLSRRLREWYELYLPEYSKKVRDNKKFSELILEKEKKAALKELSITDSMGGEFSKEDLEAVRLFSAEIYDLFLLKEEQEKYLEVLMKRCAPNVNAITGCLIGAKLIAIAGGLKSLSLFPASTVQLLGAEKALFRHMKTGSKSPKYGILHEHPLVTQAKEKGKAARMLADKISIAAKVDYFKGKYVGDKLREEIEERLGKW